MKICNVLLLKTLFLLFVGSATAQETVMLKFDEWKNGYRKLQNELVSQGVRFPRGIDIWESSRSLSSKKVAYGHMPFELIREPFVIEFLHPVIEVAIPITYASGSLHVRLQAWNSTGQVIADQETTVGDRWTELKVADSDIAKVRLTDQYGNNLFMVDNLRFTKPSIDPIPPSITLVSPVDFGLLLGPDLEVEVEAADDRELVKVTGEIFNNKGKKFKWSFCGDNQSGPCPTDPVALQKKMKISIPEDFRLNRSCTVETTDEFCRLRTCESAGNCNYRITVTAIDAGGNKVKDTKIIPLGKTNENFNPDRHNINKIKSCDPDYKEEIALAHDLLVEHAEEILADVDLFRRLQKKKMRPRREKRLKRRYVRRLKTLRVVKCKGIESEFCEDVAGRAPLSRAGRRIKICRMSRFEDLFALMAHEVGHTAGMPYRWGKKKSKHNCHNQRDNLYNIQKAALEWALDHCYDRSL